MGILSRRQLLRSASLAAVAAAVPEAAIAGAPPAGDERATGAAGVMGIDAGALRRRIREQPWAAGVYQGLRKQVSEFKALDVTIPAVDDPSGWGHNYSCPTCAEQLHFDPRSPQDHRCDVCGKTYRSPVLHAAWVYYLNAHQIQNALNASIVALVDGDTAAADLARSVLLGYADRYPDYPEHGHNVGKGRIQAQSLDEAVWMLAAMRTFVTLRDIGQLNPAQQQTVTDRMFGTACALLRRQTSIVHNIHVWTAAAVFSIAQTLGRTDDRDFAEAHLQRCLREGVLPGGSWFEGSLVYHYYTLEALMNYALAAKATGRALVLPEQIVRLFRAPLALLQPDWQFPSFNDGWSEKTLSSVASHYELGHFALRERDSFEDVLHTVYGVGKTPRDSLPALLYGPDTVQAAPLQFKRQVDVDGVAVARRGMLVGYVKATPNGGGHDHPDKPGLYLVMASSTLKAADLGTPGYGNPLHYEYYRTTVAHNTVMVDGANQRIAAAAVTHTQDEDLFSVVVTKADHAYPNVTILRTCIFGDGWALDWARAQADAPHDYLWLFHANGPFAPLDPALDFVAQDFVKHKHVENQHLLSAPPAEVRGQWSARDGGPGRITAQLWLADPKNGFVGHAEMPDLPATHKVHLLAAGTRQAPLDVATFFACAPGQTASPCHAEIRERTPQRLTVEIALADKAPPLRLQVSDSEVLRV